jgi:hypothetical protein
MRHIERHIPAPDGPTAKLAAYTITLELDTEAGKRKISDKVLTRGNVEEAAATLYHWATTHTADDNGQPLEVYDYRILEASAPWEYLITDIPADLAGLEMAARPRRTMRIEYDHHNETNCNAPDPFEPDIDALTHRGARALRFFSGPHEIAHIILPDSPTPAPAGHFAEAAQ